MSKGMIADAQGGLILALTVCRYRRNAQTGLTDRPTHSSTRTNLLANSRRRMRLSLFSQGRRQHVLSQGEVCNLSVQPVLLFFQLAQPALFTAPEMGVLFLSLHRRWAPPPRWAGFALAGLLLRELRALHGSPSCVLAHQSRHSPLVLKCCPFRGRRYTP